MWALALFRVFFGLLAVASPWLVGDGLDAYGATSVGCGVAVIAAATQMHRAPVVALGAGGAGDRGLLRAVRVQRDDISDREVYAATMIGFMLLVSAFVSPTIFRSGRSGRQRAHDGERGLEVVRIEDLERQHAVELTLAQRS